MLNPYQKSQIKGKLKSTFFNKPPVTDIFKIYTNYVSGFPYYDRGKYISVQCAFHDDSNPSMSLYKETGTYHCFACGATGDGYKFIMEKEHISFKEALAVAQQEHYTI